MSGHTPGPWTAYCRDCRYEGGEWDESEFLQWEIEGPKPVDGRGSFLQHDAHLIAAAPELLAVAERVIRIGPFYAGAILFEMAETAVKKARGEA